MKDRCPRNMLSKGLFSVASVFLCICVSLVFLVGCGMPSWVNITDSNNSYLWTYNQLVPSGQVSADGLAFTLHFVTGNEEVLNALNKVNSGLSPSIMLFYTIDTQSTNYDDTLIGQFRTVIKRDGVGKQLNLKNEDLSVLSYTTGSGDSVVSHKLFPFSYNGASVKIPIYLLNPSMPGQNKESFSAALKLEPVQGTEVTRELRLYSGIGATTDTLLGTIGRANGKNFYYNKSGLDSDTTYKEDYYNVIDNTTATTYYIHIFAAFNISAIDKSDLFTNVFWSNLIHLGWFPLTP